MNVLAAVRSLAGIDMAILGSFFVLALGIGVFVSRQAGKSSGEFFLSGKSMPWWLLGFSMVATTFSTDTPNFVTNIVRVNGVWSNWMWWAFVLTGMLTVFLYAKLWRRSNVMTDVEYYEMRYSGKEAAFLRGFRALYLGVIFNITVMAGVSLAAIKIGGVMLGWSPLQSVALAMTVTVVFSSMGGFKGVILTDFCLFIMAMVGAFAAAYFAIHNPDMEKAGVQSVGDLFSHEAVRDKLSLVPQSFDMSNADVRNAVMGLFILPLAVQWWAAWYPGAEPGGGGYLAQRMLAAKNEKHAVGATLFFQVAHYAARPWPWIIVALASMVVFPMGTIKEREAAADQLASPEVVAIVEQIQTNPEAVSEEDKALVEDLTFTSKGLASLRAGFDEKTVPNDKLDHDLAYSAMLNYLPAGWFGLVLTSLIAAYMSTISTHLNWGSSYVVNDFWKRFINKDASEKELVRVGRVSTVVMMLLTALFALQLQSALQVFGIIINIGAGTGLLFILRWFWWRINAWSEITAMIVSFVCAVTIEIGKAQAGWQFEGWEATLWIVGITTPAWIIVTLATKPTETSVLRSFVARVNPGGLGWRKVIREAEEAGEPIQADHEPVKIGLGIINMILGCILVYGVLLGVGMVLYGQSGAGYTTIAVGVLAGLGIVGTWKKSMT
ncbi:sodium:solute symporter family protein [Rubritalea tangerina]|uniref:Sodium:solute symporter family protein n=1 Tax=Rubritalea tangerina TaxID=430798 RepID=A0ABW4ZFQ4_9BACT